MAKETEVVVQQKASDYEKEAVVNGAALEAPFTKPFEGFTYIKKDWLDYEEGIETVTLNTTIGQINLPANWDHIESFVMMPEWGTVPLKRSWVVRLPTGFNGNEKYLFHYYFQARYADGSEKISDTFTQLIMPRTVEYIDHSGSCTHIVLHWSVDGWSYPQNTEMEVEGIAWGDEFSVSQVQYRSGDKLYERGRLLALQKIRSPRRFYAVIWAPRGCSINYCFNLITTDNDGVLHNRWDNNCGNNYKMTI
ncbi:MAG: hypothetical protein Kow0029_21240 [Candidatus Rifleibacteriota bacterium]